MKSLWALGEANVREVQAHMAARDQVFAYTTVMTLLDRLAKRGTAERSKRGRAYLYSPVLTRDEALKLRLRDVAQEFFDGSVERLLAAITTKSQATNAGGPAPIDITLL
jgi:predicted transcriptional regulator